MPYLHCPTPGSVLDEGGVRTATTEPGPTTAYRCCFETGGARLGCSEWVALEYTATPEPPIVGALVFGIGALLLLKRLKRWLWHREVKEDIDLSVRRPDGIWVEEGSSAQDKLRDRGYAMRMRYTPVLGSTRVLMRKD